MKAITLALLLLILNKHPAEGVEGGGLNNHQGCPQFHHLARQAATRWNVPTPVVEAIIYIESYCDPHTIGAAGERGPMQILPTTATYIQNQIGIDADLILTDPAANIHAGAYYLSLWWHRFRRIDLALSAYNGGPAHVIEASDVWPPTQHYVDKCLAHLGPAWQHGLHPAICARGSEACLLKN